MMAPSLRICPSEDELNRLLSGEAVWQDITLPRHLMTSCKSCWAWLGEKAPHLDPAALPSSEPLAMAVITAAMAQHGTRGGRFLIMRPLHLVDAQQAPRDLMAFCRLVLHETLPATLQALNAELRDSRLAEVAGIGDDLIGATASQVLCAAQPLAAAAQRHDLEAIQLSYQAVVTCWAVRLEMAEPILETAYRQLNRGSGAFVPKIIWHTTSAMLERLAGLKGELDRAPCLHNALAHLGAALQCLPANNAELQRAELLHDVAQVHLALDDPPAAAEYLEDAWQILSQHNHTDLYLGSLVRFGQAQAALAMAKAQPLASTRRSWAKRAQVYLSEVQVLGHIDTGIWGDEAQETTHLLSDVSHGSEHVTH